MATTEVKPVPASMSAGGPSRLLAKVGSPRPFALSLSKGRAEPVEAFVPHAKGFLRQAQDNRKYKLSPNGGEMGLRYLSPNGASKTAKFGFGPQADARFMRRGSREARWSN